MRDLVIEFVLYVRQHSMLFDFGVAIGFILGRIL